MNKILIIEDHDAIRSNVVEMLEDESFEVFEAEDGLIGIQLAKIHLPNLILCDVMMPRLDGYGVLDALRQDSSTTAIPFVFMSANADNSDIRCGMNLGIEDYLTKPFSRNSLLEIVRTQLQTHIPLLME